MKKLICIFSCLIFICSLQAQDKLPAFDKIDKADLEMKDCDFDPGAEALVLIEKCDIEFTYVESTGWFSESNFRVRVKVLKEKAVDRAQIKIVYRSQNRYEEVFNVKGISFNMDASGKIEESELEKRSIYQKAINKEITEISFALPNVRVGTVFEYRYKLIRKSYSRIPSWYFQQRIPVRYSAYHVIIPEYFQFTTQTTKRQQVEIKTEDEKAHSYIMRNIPGLKDEPFSSGRNDYLQRIEFQLSTINAPGFFKTVRTTWPKIIDELLEAEEFAGVYKKNIKGTGDLDEQLVNKSPQEKIRLIYNYVQRNMQWNDEEGIVTYDGIKSAWDKKNGSIAEINFILISLLKDAGIKAKPLLISTKDNGIVNAIYPFIDQFNAVMAYVKEGNDIYIMNAADKFSPYNQVPYDVVYTHALIVDKKEGGLIELESDGKFSNNLFYTCTIEPGGKLAGQVTVKSSGYARNVRLETYKKKRLNDIFEDNAGINIKVDSITVNNETDELQPFEQVVNFSGGVPSGGEYVFLPYNLFIGLGKNLFLAEDRVMDIDFYYPRSYMIVGTYYLPGDYDVNELPKNTRMMMPDTSIVLTRIMQKENNIISIKFTLDINTFGYSAEGYPFVKEFFKKMYAILDERIVLKKK